MVIPAYNEEKRIAPALKGVVEFLRKNGKDFEVIVVFDGRDNTPQVVRSFARKNSLERKIKILAFKTRLGKGGALQQGLAKAKGNSVFMIDADYSVPASEMRKLLDALEHSDIAIGSRYMRESHAEIPPVRRLFAKAFNLIEKTLFMLPYRDTQCGFKAFRKTALQEVLPHIKTTNFVWDVDMLVQARKKGLKVAEVPVAWRMRDGGTITYSNGLKTAFKMFVTLLKLRASN